MKKKLALIFLLFGVFVCFQMQVQAQAKHPKKQIIVGYGHRMPMHNPHRRMHPPMYDRGNFNININYPNSYPVGYYPMPYYSYLYGNVGASIHFSI